MKIFKILGFLCSSLLFTTLAFGGCLDLFNKGIVAQNSKNDLKAIKLFTKAIECNLPADKVAAAYYHRGVSEDTLDKYQDSITDLKKAIELNPKFISAYYNLAKIYEKHSELNNAIDNYVEVIKLDPKNVNALYRSGKIYSRKRLKDKALEQYKKLQTINKEKAEKLMVIINN